MGEFCKLLVATATCTAVWVFFIRLQLKSSEYLETVDAIVFGILLPIAAIAAIIFLARYRLRQPADSRANGFGLALIYALFIGVQIFARISRFLSRQRFV
jgi:hypothetical protein